MQENTKLTNFKVNSLTISLRLRLRLLVNLPTYAKQKWVLKKF